MALRLGDTLWDHSTSPQILAHKDRVDHQVYPDRLDSRVSKETVALLESRAHQVHLAPAVYQDLPGPRVLMEIQGRMDLPALEEHREIRVLVDRLVCREFRE